MKKGFTLAEVLITLMIVGVVAAITMPSLSTNVNKQSIGPSLAKAYNTLSNANEMLLLDYSANRLTDVIASEKKEENEAAAATYIRLLKKYAKIHTSNMVDTPNHTNYNNTKDWKGILGIPCPLFLFASDDGIIFYPYPTFSQTMKDAPKPYTGDYMILHVDINGNAKPNAMGKDMFVFAIDDNGTVIPYGGSAWNDYCGKDASDDPLYMDSDNYYCYVENGKTKVGTGETCAGYIADNGWKVKY